ncbi:SH3 domain-containing protein [Anaerococcus sp. mt242]|uniref:aggregation-promoting factor C-terminal-like domain-containing protein n=1 Tax=Anaerococcus sp. mt242 TaxID=2661917 RepID=UPI00193152FE|nr:SH3 domain-containing protein [Anaerococcus sp. mt242]MBM0046600.1 SH3 domain-containing protein [Anaerococcus sp. mt242]
MFNLKKYAIAAALVIPTAIGFGAKDSHASKLAINKNLAQGVNVRTEAKEGDNVIGLIDDKEKSYEVLGKEGDWTKIEFNGKEAFVVSKWFVELENTKLVADANFRDAAKLDSNVIDVLKANTEVEVLGLADNGYVKVRVNDKEGYVYHDLLQSFRQVRIENQKAQQAKAQSTNNNNQAQAQAQSQTQTQTTTQTYQQAPQQQSYQGSSSWAKEWIAQRESGGSYSAYNPNGGYYGRYQLNPSLVPYGASPAQQEAAADNYVAQRYGSWEAAQQFWASNGWY